MCATMLHQPLIHSHQGLHPPTVQNTYHNTTSTPIPFVHPDNIHPMQTRGKSSISLVELPSHRKGIGCKWVFRIKQNPDSFVHKYKAILVAKGFHQQPSFDFQETFSLVVKPTIVRTTLSLLLSVDAGTPNKLMQTISSLMIFFEEVYMQQPPTLKQRTITSCIRQFMDLNRPFAHGFKRLTSALSILALFIANVILNCLLFLKAIIVLSCLFMLMISLISYSTLYLKVKYSICLKELENLEYFLVLGIEVHHLQNRAKKEDAKDLPTPMVTNTKLNKHKVDLFDELSFYHSIYATITCPEISYVVNKVCQFLSHSLGTHWKVIKHIIHYLNGFICYGMTLSTMSPCIRLYPLLPFLMLTRDQVLRIRSFYTKLKVSFQVLVMFYNNLNTVFPPHTILSFMSKQNI
ncbi:hypothetical protein CR513_15100, partial [Mucuna pruriens]